MVLCVAGDAVDYLGRWAGVGPVVFCAGAACVTRGATVFSHVSPALAFQAVQGFLLVFGWAESLQVDIHTVFDEHVGCLWSG